MTPPKTFAALSVVTVLLALLLAGPVGAHTGFDHSNPAVGAQVEGPLSELEFVFTGEAEPAGEGFVVLDGTGMIREVVETYTTDGLTWVALFDPPLEPGEIGVRWNVKAPDAHPIDGSFTFTLLPAPSGTPPTTAVASTETAPSAEPPASRQAQTPTSPIPASVDEGVDGGFGAVSAAAGAGSGLEETDMEAFLGTAESTWSADALVFASRLLVIAASLLAVGAVVFVGMVLRSSKGDIRYVLFWVRWAGLLVIVGTTAGVLGQLVVENDGNWSGAVSPSSLWSVLWSAFGAAVVLRLAGGAAVVVGARDQFIAAVGAPDPVIAIRELASVGSGTRTGSPDTSNFWSESPDPIATEPLLHRGDHMWLPTTAGLIGSALLVVAYLFDGHTVTEGNRFLTGLVDLVHVGGAGVWAGGVVMIAAVLFRRHRRGEELRSLQLAVRFSVVAAVSLVAVALAGLALAVIILESPAQLWSTPWGRFLVAKSALVAVVAAVGGYNHKVLIPKLESAPDDPVLAAEFRSVVTREATLMVAVAVLTAFLVGASAI
ncbi:MAG: copper resistance protein CopC [Acidimicrobiales bacterium]|nr:copper resistance protein CopC [Acidimicrobiales bacterium]